MSVNALTGHGTKIAVQLTPGGSFTNIAEQGDITPPALSRNEFDSTTQLEDIDSYVLGVLRRSTVTVAMNFIPTEETHDEQTGLYKLMIDNTMTGWRFTFPDATAWIASGQVTNIQPTAPVDGKLSANVTLRFSGAMTINGVEVGAEAA